MAHPSSKSYLLRLWREHPGAPLRATLIHVSQPDTAQHFATLEMLFVYLRAEEGQATDQDDQTHALYCTPRPPEAKDSNDAF